MIHLDLLAVVKKNNFLRCYTANWWWGGNFLRTFEPCSRFLAPSSQAKIVEFLISLHGQQLTTLYC